MGYINVKEYINNSTTYRKRTFKIEKRSVNTLGQ